MTPLRRLLHYFSRYKRSLLLGAGVRGRVGRLLARSSRSSSATRSNGWRRRSRAARSSVTACCSSARRRWKGVFLYLQRLDHHRRVAAHRVRHAQRLLRASAVAAAHVLPGAADGRSDVARHERPLLGAHADRPGGHALRLVAARRHRRVRDDAAHRRRRWRCWR